MLNTLARYVMTYGHTPPPPAEHGQLELFFPEGPPNNRQVSISPHCSFSSLPVLQVYTSSLPVLELGLNIPHIRTEQAYFKQLLGKGKLSVDQMYDLLTNLLDLVLQDPSLSSFEMARASSFSIHTSDPNLEQLLKTEGARLAKDNLHYDLNSGYLTPQRALDMIARDISLYARMLIEFDDERSKHAFHRDLCREARDMKTAYQRSLPIRMELRTLEASVKRLKATGRVIDLTALRAQCKETFRPPEVEVLETVFQQDHPKPPYHGPRLWPHYSAITCKKTTLHERAHKDYDASIMTFELTEARRRVTERRKIIRAANQLEQEQR